MNQLSDQVSQPQIESDQSILNIFLNENLVNKIGIFNGEKKASIADLPHSLIQSKILMLFNSQDLFRLRLVSSEWCDLIKTIWCQVVKDEMLAQVQNLDLLYEKETTAKLLEFKMKYLVSYAELMRNYFVNMIFSDIQQELERIDNIPENQDLQNLGQKLILIVCLIVCPEQVQDQPTNIEQITDGHLQTTKDLVQTNIFKDKFRTMCQMDVIPDITLNQIRQIKENLIDPLVQANPENVQRLGNAGRLVSSWIDGVLEYTILKHEVVVLRLKNKRVLDRIQEVSKQWPKKKEFIEGAYKLLLFTKGQRNYAKCAIKIWGGNCEQQIQQQLIKEDQISSFYINKKILNDKFFDYSSAFQRVMKSWYEKRIEEETIKNQKLQELHDSLIQIRDLQKRQAEMSQMDSEKLRHQTQDYQTDKNEKTDDQNKQSMEQEIEGLRQKIYQAQNQISETRQTINAQRQMIEQARELTRQANTLCTEVNNMRDQIETFRQITLQEESNGSQPQISHQTRVEQEETKETIQAEAEIQLDQQVETTEVRAEPPQQINLETQIQNDADATTNKLTDANLAAESNTEQIQQFLNQEPQIQEPQTQEQGQIETSQIATQTTEPFIDESTILEQSRVQLEQAQNSQAQISRTINEVNRTQTELMQSILQVGSIFNKHQSQIHGVNDDNQDEDLSSSDSDDQNQKNSSTNCKIQHQNCHSCGESRLIRRKKRQEKKPQQLRKELFEIILRKRIFLTDRIEKIEKLLVSFGLISEKQLQNQQAEMASQSAQENFNFYLKDEMKKTNYLIQQKEDQNETEQPILEIALENELLKITNDDQWYELYKSITNEKDIAEKDQQRMIRRERRKLKRKQQLRKKRIEQIIHNLKIREAYRKKQNIKMRSTSVDRYDENTDKEYEEQLIKEQILLREQIASQHRNNQNMQSVLMGLAAVRLLLDSATSNTDQIQGVGPQLQEGTTAHQLHAALQAEQLLRAAQNSITQLLNVQEEPQSVQASLQSQGATIMQNPLEFVIRQEQESQEFGTQTSDHADTAVQTENQENLE